MRRGGIIGAGWRVRKLEQFPGVWQRALEPFKLFSGTAVVSPAKLLQNTSRRFQSGSSLGPQASRLQSCYKTRLVGSNQALHWDRRRLACKVVTKHVSSVPIRLFTGIAGVSPARLLQNTSRRFQSGSSLGSQASRLQGCYKTRLVGSNQALHWDRRRLACKVVTKHVSSVPIRLFTGIAGVSPARLLQNTSRRFQSGSSLGSQASRLQGCYKTRLVGSNQALHWDRRRLACKVVTKHVSSVPIRLFTGTAGVSPARLLQNTSRRFQSGSSLGPQAS